MGLPLEVTTKVVELFKKAAWRSGATWHSRRVAPHAQSVARMTIRLDAWTGRHHLQIRTKRAESLEFLMVVVVHRQRDGRRRAHEGLHHERVLRRTLAHFDFRTAADGRIENLLSVQADNYTLGRARRVDSDLCRTTTTATTASAAASRSAT